MADNTQNIQPQAVQQPAQPTERPVREFVQVDTSTNADIEKKPSKNIPLTKKVLKGN